MLHVYKVTASLGQAFSCSLTTNHIISSVKKPSKLIMSATPAKKPKAPDAHPPVAVMVTAAITSLKERNGSSLAAIKKYIAANYKCDVAKLAPFIRKFLKKGVADGKLKQIKASYKIDKTKVEKPQKPKKKPVKKEAKKPKKSAAKKPKKADKPKKKPASKPKKSPKKAAKPKKAKTPKKSAVKPKKAKTPKKAAKKPAKK